PGLTRPYSTSVMEFPDCSPGRTAQRIAVTLGAEYQSPTSTGPVVCMITIVLSLIAEPCLFRSSKELERVMLLQSRLRVGAAGHRLNLLRSVVVSDSLNYRAILQRLIRQRHFGSDKIYFQRLGKAPTWAIAYGAALTRIVCRAGTPSLTKCAVIASSV